MSSSSTAVFAPAELLWLSNPSLSLLLPSQGPVLYFVLPPAEFLISSPSRSVQCARKHLSSHCLSACFVQQRCHRPAPRTTTPPSGKKPFSCSIRTRSLRRCRCLRNSLPPTPKMLTCCSDSLPDC